MFQQTFIDHTGKSRPWTYLLGVSGELLALTVLVLLPLIYTEKLTTFGFSHLAITAPVGLRQPKPPKLEKTNQPMVRSPRPWNANFAIYQPVSIPLTTPTIIDTVDTAQGGYVPGGIPGDPQGLPFGISGQVPPPPGEARPPHKDEKAVVSASGPVKVSSGVQEAKIIRRVIPIYPALARQARVQGTVKLMGIIGRDGVIRELRVLNGHPLLVSAAVDAVKQWVYRPTLLSGEPTEVIAPIDVHFTLNQ